MFKLLFLIILIQDLLTESLASSDSCFYCSGTPQCEDPLDFDEVQPRDCVANSVCLKYTTFLKHMLNESEPQEELTYRECFEVIDLEEDICSFLKDEKKGEISQMNYTLASFRCQVCNTTNCNMAPSIPGSLLSLSYFIILLLYL